MRPENLTYFSESTADKQAYGRQLGRAANHPLNERGSTAQRVQATRSDIQPSWND